MHTTTLVIDVDRLHHNVQTILSYKQGHFLFVLKGNAYGHGYIPILGELEPYEDIKWFGVSTPEEALFLSNKTTKPIVILGYTPSDMLETIVQQGIIPSLFDYDQAQLISSPANVWINMDTGFHRLGGAPTKMFVNEIQQTIALPNVTVQGIFTHLALRDREIDSQRIVRFLRMVEPLNIPYYSISDSIAYTRFDTTENMYRIGALMYGLMSDKEKGKIDVKPTTSLFTHVTRVHHYKENTDVFYRSHVSAGTTIATIQIGYADGLFRTMKQDSYVLINNQRCPYIEIGMDQSIVDVTDKIVAVGDTVTIFDGTTITVGMMATWCDTNKNNIITSIGCRVQRQYNKNGTTVLITNIGGEVDDHKL